MIRQCPCQRLTALLPFPTTARTCPTESSLKKKQQPVVMERLDHVGRVFPSVADVHMPSRMGDPTT
ncbi:uncharacterized protein SETTUDRAFT_158410 [Exserohilum turcica Et28A]|uniref:Uncharacterized protein n=1 Tax=Exserohilum turcicum (strain 28A) TaxID=671987 RepID=R0J1R7_EXST2|nr:uncharacterized protein SETTUDRAFT_158410 [Exserohilum turcica Et28A]EOA90920.1 hypothetical protein SETTUDRAFT_158410 [Exserohilum turcica Et28A]